MAEGKKIGADMVKGMAQLGLEELRNANIPQPEPPNSYQQALDASIARGQSQEKEGMSR